MPKAAPASRSAPCRTRGLVVDFGEALEVRRRTAVLAALVERMPALARVVDRRALAAAAPLGRGATDVLVPFAPGRDVDVRTAWDLVHALRAQPEVADAEPAVRIPAAAPAARGRAGVRGGPAAAPLPQASARDWSIVNAGVRAAWDASAARGAGVVVGHPDTGYTHHPQIDTPRLLRAQGYDFEDGRADPLDAMDGANPGHGTGTASVLFSDDSPAPGVYGVAPAARLVPFRVSDSVVHFDFTNLAQALYRARDVGCHLVSMSLGGPWAGRALGRAVDALVGADVVPLAAAGNVWPWVIYPARFDAVVAVAASNAADAPWNDSAGGEEVDVAAPGESVWRALTQLERGTPAYTIAQGSGTSYAAATAAGACALWLSHHGVDALRRRYPGRLAAVFMHLLKTQGFRAVRGWNTAVHGPGILDAAALLAAPLPAQAPAPARVQRAGVARAERSYAWARLQPYFPALPPEALARALLPAFGADAAAAARRLAEVIDEVEFLVATDAALRARIERGAARGAAAGTRGAHASTAAGTRRILASRGSARLAAALAP